MVHVYPVGDIVEHNVMNYRKNQCWCGPKVEIIITAAAGGGWVVVHNSLDGREKNEHTAA